METRLSNRWCAILIVAMLLAASVLLAGSGSSVASPPLDTAPAIPMNTFSGYVRKCPSTVTGISGVTVRLQRYIGSGTWTQVASTTTNASGAFQLSHAPEETTESYRIVEIDPPGYTSCNATPGLLGSKISNNIIQYDDLAFVSSYGGNIFYDEPTNSPPQPISVTPHDGANVLSAVQVFTIRASDADGANDITQLNFEVDDGCGWPIDHAVYVSLQPLSNRIYLQNDAGQGALEGILPGPGQYGTGTLQNSQVILRLDKTRFTRSGQVLTLEVGLRFRTSYLGVWRLCAEARDSYAARSAEFGTWTVMTAATPTPTATPTPAPQQGQVVAAVWHDLDTDGNQDRGEPPLEGVKVRLFRGSTRLSICFTDADGRCVFSNLPPGVYRVLETDPQGYGSTTPNEVAADLSVLPLAAVAFGDRVLPELEVELTAQVIPSGALLGEARLAESANIGDVVRFAIRVRNTGTTNVNPVEVQLAYNTACWDLVSYSDPPNDPADDGWLDWTIVMFGNPLHPNDELTLSVELRAVANCSGTQVCASAIGLDAALGTIQSALAGSCLSWDIATAALSVELRFVEIVTGGKILGDSDLPGGVDLLADVTATVSDTITMEIVIKNTGTSTIVQLPVSFTYHEGWFTEGFTDPRRDTAGAISLPPPSFIQLGWNDITTTLGDLAPGATLKVRVDVHAAVPGNNLNLCAGASGWDAQLRFVPEVVDCLSVDTLYRVFANVWHDKFAPFGFPPAAAEPRLPGATLELWGPGNVLVSSCTTDGFGSCAMTKVQPNVNYVIRETNPPGFDLDTTPNEYPFVQSTDPNAPIDLFFFGDRRSPRIEIGAVLPPEACISDTVTAAVTIWNRGDLPLESTALTLSYDTSQLRYLGKSSLPTVDNVNDGQLNWANLFPGLGGLAPDASHVVTAAFHAEAIANPALITAAATGRDTGNNPVPIVTNQTGMQILPFDPGPCQDILLDGDFEGGFGNWWVISGGGGPGCPPVPGGPSPSDPHGGAQSLQLGGVDGCSTGIVAVRQVALPATAKSAVLTFWYRMNDPVREVGGPFGPPDQLRAFVTQGGNTIETPALFGTTGWTRAAMDITPFAGGNIVVSFLMLQDGQVDQPAPEAFIDDVQVCVNICGSPHDRPGDPTAPPICWKGDFVDYAPSGVPDFDQRQSHWRNAEGQWTHDAPVALANSLWWFDSKFEPGQTPPPTISDGYPLISAGANDDHAATNVIPLVNDLAMRADTDGKSSASAHQGTRVADLRDGVGSYLAERGMVDDYTVALEAAPAWDWVRSEVNRSEDVILLLGFYEFQVDGWRRLGGHYVTSAGVGCTDDVIAISDPFHNRAEEGGAGRTLPSGVHDHPAEPPDGVHNNAARVSHDVYAVVASDAPGATWALQGYAPGYDAIADFAGLNVQPGQETAQYQGGAIVAAVEYALAVSPREPGAAIWIDPAQSSVAVGEVFQVTLRADALGVGVDKAHVSLGFDPAVLVVVDALDAPTTAIEPGASFDAYLLNLVDNSAGTIDLVTARQDTPLEGSLALGTIRFRAKQAAGSPGALVQFLREVDHQTDLLLGSQSVLTSATDGVVLVQGQPATLSGSIALQGRPGAPHGSWIGPVEVSLFQPGATVPARVAGLSTDDRGRFSLSDIPAGTYNIRVKGLHTLANRRGGVVLGSGDNHEALGTLKEGDANNDNRIDAADASALAASFGLSEGSPGFDAAADFDNNGVVNAADQALLAANYGEVGDVIVTLAPPRGAAGLLREDRWAEPGAAGGATLRLLPASTASGVFDLDIQLATGGGSADAVAVHLDFDPRLLAVVNASGTPVDTIQPRSGMTTLHNGVDNVAGTIDYAAMKGAGGAVKGTVTVARARFKVIGMDIGSTWVRFSTTPPRQSSVFFDGEPTLGGLYAARVQLATAVSTVRIPLLLKG